MKPPTQVIDIALVTESRFCPPCESSPFINNVLLEDAILRQCLDARGITTARVEWTAPHVDWSRFRMVVLRTPWNYSTQIERFLRWTWQVEQVSSLVNAREILAWNTNKRYLEDLKRSGISVVDTMFVSHGTSLSLERVMKQHDWREVVLKPVVSAGGRETHLVREGEADRGQALLDRLLLQEDMMIQPFQRAVTEQGEWTVVVIDGQPTHAVRKVPRGGEFRVQDDFGGTVHPDTAPRAALELAEKAMTVGKQDVVYGRVDMVKGNDGTFKVMELELTEPELWFRFSHEAADRLAQGLSRRLDEASR